MSNIRISLNYIFVVCISLSIGSAVLSAILVSQGDQSSFESLKSSQRETGEGQLFGITLFVSNYMTFMQTNTESNVRLLQYIASVKGPNFISTPKTFSKDINDTLLTAWLPAAGSLYQPFWSYTSLYPAYWTDNWTVAQAAQHWVDYHQNGERWQYMSLPEDEGANNQSYARRITWTKDMKPIVHDPPDYSFSSYSALGNISGVNWFTPMYPWISLDGNSYWYFTHQTGVRINGVMTVVQTMDDAIRWQNQVDRLVSTGSHMIVTDNYKKVVVTTLPEEKKRLATCTDDVSAQSATNGEAPCINHDADQHPTAFITEVYTKSHHPAWEDMSLSPAPMKWEYLEIAHVMHLVMSQTVFNQNELRINVIWLQPMVTMDLEARNGVYVGIAFLAFLPTFILCVISIVSILRPLRTLGTTMVNLTDSLISLENQQVVIPASNSVFTEMDTVGTEFETLGTTIVAISKYIPKQLVRHELGVVDTEDTNNGDGNNKDGEEHMEDSKLSSSHSTMSRSGASGSRGHRRRMSMSGTSNLNSSSHISTKALTTMQKKNVAVMFLNIRNFHERIEDLLPRYPTIIKSVETAVGKHKGILDSFHGDHFMITFNGLSPCGAPLKAAAGGFGEISASLKKEKPIIRLTGGLCAGSCNVGQMGSDTAKRFCILSPVVSSAAYLQSVCGSFCLSECLAFANAREEVQSAVYYYYSGKVPSLPTSSTAKPTSMSTVITLGRCVPKGESDEWMYELEAGDSTNPFSMINSLWVRVLKDPKEDGLQESILELNTVILAESEAYPAYQDLLHYVTPSSTTVNVGTVLSPFK